MRKLTLLFALVLLTIWSAAAQVTSVKGQVFASGEDEPLVGATVSVKGTNKAVMTDLDGRFELTGLKPGDKITVSYVGYTTKTLTPKAEMTITLDSSTDTLDDLIVVAFGKQKRESFTGSASVLTADEITRQQVTNPIEALNGKVAGLNMLESNSFSTDPEVTIRGIGSLNASTSPLIVLDGLPYNGYWNDINPADIANITVLKDAASNALYGARGANGVILITTKSGQRGKTTVTATAKWGANHDGRVKYKTINKPGEYYEAYYMGMRNYYMNYMGQNGAQAHLSANNILGAPYTQGGLAYMVYSVPANQQLIGTNGKLNPNATLGNRVAYGNQFYTLYPDNWLDAGLRTGFRQEYNISLSGGNERFNFFSSLGYLNEEGIAYGNDIERFNARMKAEYKAFDFLRVGGTAGYTHNITNSNGAVFNLVNTMAPVFPLYIRDGNGTILTDSNGKRYDYGDGDNAGLYRSMEGSGNSVQDDRLNRNKNVSNAFNIQGYVTADLPYDFRLTVNGSGESLCTPEAIATEIHSTHSIYRELDSITR